VGRIVVVVIRIENGVKVGGDGSYVISLTDVAGQGDGGRGRGDGDESGEQVHVCCLPETG